MCAALCSIPPHPSRYSQECCPSLTCKLPDTLLQRIGRLGSPGMSAFNSGSSPRNARSSSRPLKCSPSPDRRTRRSTNHKKVLPRIPQPLGVRLVPEDAGQTLRLRLFSRIEIDETLDDEDGDEVTREIFFLWPVQNYVGFEPAWSARPSTRRATCPTTRRHCVNSWRAGASRRIEVSFIA